MIGIEKGKNIEEKKRFSILLNRAILEMHLLRHGRVGKNFQPFIWSRLNLIRTIGFHESNKGITDAYYLLVSFPSARFKW